MESLFWVLVHTCLTGTGPGLNQRRLEELKRYSTSFYTGLYDVVVNYFDGSHSRLQRKKEYLVDCPELLKGIVKHFHPAYSALKPIICKWWFILTLGYKYRGNEFYNIHSHIHHILQDAIATIGLESADAEQLRNECKQHCLETLNNGPATATPGTPKGATPDSVIATDHQAVSPISSSSSEDTRAQKRQRMD
ncbi:hypothetical protein H0H87_011176 [Tephrocybe sp. NHM501043]|nr:hypothetical protein H0H87_011176 [Tephrocybe sp. NHM501043]